MRSPSTTMRRVKLSREDEEFLETLNRLDFAPLAFSLMNPEDEPGLSLEQAGDAIKKYKGFLFLCHACKGKTVSPSKYVDHVWHTHILDTELYIAQTALLFGHYLHHFPYFGKRNAKDERDLATAFDFTKAQALSYFGWDDDDWCGTGRMPGRTIPGRVTDLKDLSMRGAICKPPPPDFDLLKIPTVEREKLMQISSALVKDRVTAKGFSGDLVKLEV